MEHSQGKNLKSSAPDCESHNLKRSRARDAQVGQSIRRYRKAAKMSMKALADRLCVSYQQIQKYELGLNRIAAGRLMDVADILNVPVSEFFEVQTCAANGATSPDASEPLRNSETVEEYPEDVEAHLLVKAFFRIGDPARRLDALSYVRSLADGKVA